MSAVPPPPPTAPAAPYGETAASPLGVPDDGLDWRRMHPVTPVVRGWGVIVVLFLVGFNQVATDVEGAGEVVSSVNPLWFVGGLAFFALVVFLYSALAWRMMRYAVGAEALHLRQGIVFRQQRQARLDRLQAVDIVQPLVARIFGLAELRLEVAGGADSAVKVGFLKIGDAETLRAELLARAAGVTVAEGEAAPVAPEEQVIQVEPGMLVGSLLRTGALLAFLAILVGLGVAAVLAHTAAPLLSAIPGLIGFGSYLAQRFVGEYGFVGAVSPDGIRLRRGLLETRSQTIPPGRVQAIRLSQPLLWRRKDWWRVEVNVAGYGSITADAKSSSQVLLPVGDRRAALDALWLVLPDLGLTDALAVLDEALVGSGPSETFTTSPRSARILDPLTWRRNGFAVAPRALLLRQGRLVRQLVVVPHERTQSLGVEQGPLQRRLGVASFALHTTVGPVTPQIAHLAEADAARLLAEQDERARIARNSEGPELWMRHIASDPAGDPAAEPTGDGA